MIFYNCKWLKYIDKSNTKGMALYPFIFVKTTKADTPEWLIRHERIHLRQQREMLIFGFLILYAVEYFINKHKGMGHKDAYKAISFEVEAREGH